MRFIYILFIFLFCGCSSHKEVHPSGLEIEEINPNKKTMITKQNLLLLTQIYDLSPFLFTKKIRIQTSIVPQPHPVLTLNTRNSDHPNRLLSTFLHEQLHWWLELNKTSTLEAIKDLESVYSKNSTIKVDDQMTRHLIICYLEYRALEFYLGKRQARDIITHFMRKDKIYPWIYYQVLYKNYYIKKVITKFKLLPPPLV